MSKENYQARRAEELDLPIGTGKRYSREDLISFIKASEENEAQKYVDRFTRNVLIGFATPPTLAVMLNCLPYTGSQVLEAAKGITLTITAAEIGWVGGGVIIEGGKVLKNAITSRIPGNMPSLRLP